MIRVVPAIHHSGGRLRPGQHVLLLLASSPIGPLKLAYVPVPVWLWKRVPR